MADLTTASPPEATTQHDNDALYTAASLRAANILKAQGNDYFRASRWDEALVAYRSGLDQLPKRIQQVDDISTEGDNSSGELPTEEAMKKDQPLKEEHLSTTDDPSPSQAELDEYAKLRAVLNANIGACYVKLGDHKQAADACSQALIDDPQYVKALQRRASSNEVINSWSSLTAAMEDYTALLKLLPPSSSQSRDTERSMKLLKPRIEDAQKKETAEMLDKLKGLGNSILGNFGLSTDNFKLEPNGQGGYSMNFSR
ncbi:hypothetical protein D9615_005234 [Tricholomella constricta]|uniref:TPR-like protein n=1 Tax=Tricholomella constricta TaxID=117010 RepID=A0A8H5H6H5_9AGAR|nr:hypothetical protein D9615_005234 [Tricholomella constricta]